MTATTSPSAVGAAMTSRSRWNRVERPRARVPIGRRGADAAAELLVQQARIRAAFAAVVREAVEPLEDRQVGQRLADLEAAAVQETHRPVVRRVRGDRAGELGEQPALADAGLAADQHDRPAPRRASTRAARSRSRSSARPIRVGLDPRAMPASSPSDGSPVHAIPRPARRNVTFGGWPPDGWTATIAETESQP